MHKTEGLVKYVVVFFKLIRMQYNLMVVIFIILLQTWKWQQFVQVPLNIMRYRTRNVCHIVVINDKVSSSPVRRQIKIQQTYVQQ